MTYIKNKRRWKVCLPIKIKTQIRIEITNNKIVIMVETQITIKVTTAVIHQMNQTLNIHKDQVTKRSRVSNNSSLKASLQIEEAPLTLYLSKKLKKKRTGTLKSHLMRVAGSLRLIKEYCHSKRKKQCLHFLYRRICHWYKQLQRKRPRFSKSLWDVFLNFLKRYLMHQILLMTIT